MPFCINNKTLNMFVFTFANFGSRLKGKLGAKTCVDPSHWTNLRAVQSYHPWLETQPGFPAIPRKKWSASHSCHSYARVNSSPTSATLRLKGVGVKTLALHMSSSSIDGGKIIPGRKVVLDKPHGYSIYGCVWKYRTPVNPMVNDHYPY